MKRVKILVAFVVLIAMTVIGLFACNDKQKALGALTFTANENGISFTYDGDLSFYYSEDGGEATSIPAGFSFDFSEEVGEHVVDAYAEDGSGKKVAEGKFTYETKKVSLSDLTFIGRTVTWTAAAKAVYVRETGDYELTTESSYTATSDDAVVRVKAEGGYDEVNAVYYVGDAVTKSVRLMPEQLSAPKLKVSGKSVTWNRVQNATGYAVSYDGGAFASASSATISDVIGNHSILVKAIGDGVNYGDSATALLSYQTVRAQAQVSKISSEKVMLSADYGGCSVSTDGVNFSALTASEYAVTRSAKVYFRANGGYDATKKINYVTGEAVGIDLICSAATDAVLEDASNGVSSFWSVKQSANGTWQNSDAQITLGKKYDGTPALRLTARNDNVSYRFSASYSLSDAYDHLSFYYRGDGVSALNLTLAKEGQSFAISRDLGVMPAYWVKVTLRFDEDGWTVGDVPLRTLWESRNSEIESERPASVPQKITDAFSLSELASYFDRLDFVVCGRGGGIQTSLLLDDLLFGYDADEVGSVTQPLYALGTSYVSYEEVGGVQNELLLFLDENDAFRLYSTKLDENFTVNGTYRLYAEDAVLTLEDPDSDFSLTLSFLENGRSAVIRASSGAHASHFVVGNVFGKAADLLCEYEEESAVNGWTAYTYHTQEGVWEPLSALPLDSSSRNGSGVLRLSTGKDLIYKVVFNEAGERMGLANYFSIDFGNYDQDADEVLVKFIAKDIFGEVYYIKGSESAYWSCAAGDDLVTFEHTLPVGILLSSLELIVEYRGNNAVSHLYFDNLKAEYHADPSLFSEYAAPEIEKGEYALTFTHSERARIEYSVNWSEEWTQGETYAIPTDAGSYNVRVRAVIEANGAVSKVAVYNFTVEKVFVSQITVTIGENDQTASWSTNGVCSVRVDEKGSSGYEQGEYRPYDQNSYVTDKNVVLNVRATGYFDEANDKYYVGSTEVSKKIIVDAVLSAPVITPTEQGVTWSEVPDANAYAVSVNGGDEVIREDRILSFAIYEGTYSVRVKAVLVQNGEVVAYGNFSGAYTYAVKNVSLSQPTVLDDTATWTAEAYKVYLSDNGGEYVENAVGSFTPEEVGAHNFLVKAVAGFSLSENTYYYAENDVILGDVIVVENLLKPTLLLNRDKNGLYWAYLDDESEIAHTVADMRSIYPFLSYSVSVNGGAWTPLSADVYLFPSEAGEYSVRVMAKGNDKNYRDSEASDAFDFEVKVISLTDISVEKGATESVASYDFVALSAERKIGVNGAFFPTTEKSFTATATTTISVRVSGGWDATNGVYYAGEPIEKTKKVVKPEKLATPVISHDSVEISWAMVPHATGYRIVVNGETETVVKTLKYSYSTAIGDYDVEVIAISETDSEQYPDSDAATITYHVSAVALENLSYVGATISWTYTGLLYLYIGDSAPSAGDWTPYDQSEYVNESGNEETVWVEARAGYRSVTTQSGDEVFIYRGATVQGKQIVKNFSLKAPELTQSGNTLSWVINANATCYKYKMLPIDASGSDVAAAEENLSDWTELGAGEHTYVFNKATDNNKLFLLKAIGNNNNISDSPATVCGLRAIYLTVDDSHRLDGYITWQKSGILKKQEVVNHEYGDYEVIRVSECCPDKTMTVNLRCSAGYDETDNVWYFGDTFNEEFKEELLVENIEIIVAIKLAAPTVEMRETTVYLGAVQYADAYKIQVNGGAVTVDSNRMPPLESTPGDYTLTIRACSTNSIQYPDSDPVTFTYSVKTVAVGAITDDGGVARFTATGLLFIKEGEGDFTQISSDATSYAPAATTTVTLKAQSGTDLENKIRYVGETKTTAATEIIVPIQLDTPTLTETVDQITIGVVDNATGYSVKIDNGEWTQQSGRAVLYPTSAGEHTVYVKAVSTSAQQYPASEAAQTTFTTQAVTLTSFAVSGATFSWNAEAYDVKVKVNKGDYTSVYGNSYTVTEEGTNTVYVRAYSGFVSSSRIYYACGQGYLQESGSVTVSKLSKPTLSVSGTKITWSAVSGASGYEVKVGSGSYVTQTSTEKALSNQEGKYKVYVRAKGNGSTVLSSDAATIEYTTKNVTLSDISVVGTTASWSSVSYKTYISLNGGSYSETTQTSYTPTTEGTHTVKVKATGGWNNSSKIYYYTSSAVEKTATIRLLKLSAPELTTNTKGVIWSAVPNATTYAVKVDSGSFKTQTDRSVTFSTTSGTHTVYVQAIGSSSGGYQDSNVSSFTYETKQSSLTILSSSSTAVTWIADGLKAQYSTDGTNFTDAAYSGYTATANGQVSFRAIGGYDSSAKTFYNGTSAVQRKTFSLPGLCIGNNFEAGTGSWTKEVYNTNGWENTTATEVKSVADANGAGSAIMFKSYLNGMAYRFGYHFGNLPATYKSLSFDIKLNEYTGQGTTLTFQDSDGGGTYVDYSLNHLSLNPGVWYHVTIYFEDDNLVINMGGTEYKPSQAISSPLVGRSKFYEKIKALDHMCITVKGNVSNGPQAYTYIDNFQFSTNSASTGKTRITGVEYGFNDGTVGSNYTASGWKAYKYGNSGFEENPNVLKVESGVKALSLYCGGCTSKVTYNVGGSVLGEFNHFAINVGTEASSVSYSIELITESGSSIYVAGGAEYRATLTSTSGASNMKTIVFNFQATKIRSIVIHASESSGNGHFYVDNIVFSKLT